MENAVDALKIAFALFVFIMALSITIFMFNMAKETGDIVLASSDVTAFMEYKEKDSIGTIVKDGDRIVGLETIIPTLYKYYKERYTVVFMNANGTPLTIYESKTNPALWSTNYTNKYYHETYNKLYVCAFDIEEETRRHEPWVGSASSCKENLDKFLSGETFIDPSGGESYNYGSSTIKHDWGDKGFIEEFKNTKFRESLGEYIVNEIDEAISGDTSATANVEPKTKRVIIYTIYNG